MIENFASPITLPASLKGSLLIEDYITLDRTNREWTKILWEISNGYETLRNKILSIRHLIANLTSESTNQSEPPVTECLMRVTESLDHSLNNFSIWEDSSYYLGIDNLEGSSENFISRMAHDILRNRNEMHGFSYGLLLQIEHMATSTESAGYCDGDIVEYEMNKATSQLLEAKVIMQNIIENYTALQTAVSQNHGRLRLPSIHNYTREEYVMWVDDTLSTKCIC